MALKKSPKGATNMNKQQLIENLKSLIIEPALNDYEKVENITLSYAIELAEHLDDNTNKTTPSHYQGTIQPIDLINAQDLNFNLGNVVKYVCRAGKKQGENVLSDLEKAKNYINYEIERIEYGGRE